MSNPAEKEDILYAFALEPNHDRATLERYLREYPDLAEELIDLMGELRLGRARRPSFAEQAADTGAGAAWQEFLACGPEEACAAEAPNPFARFKGQAFADLADALDVPRSFLTPFRDGLVAAASIPAAFRRRLADAMGVTVEAIQTYLLAPQPAPIARAFKSDGKPSHQGQKTFRELVESTEMSDERRRILLQDCDADGLL